MSRASNALRIIERLATSAKALAVVFFSMAYSAGERLAGRGSDRIREAGRSHGAVMLVLGGVAILRLVSFVLFAVLLTVGPSDVALFRMVIVIDGALSMLLEVAIVFVALMVFSNVRRIEAESDRIQLFMDSVYRRLP